MTPTDQHRAAAIVGWWLARAGMDYDEHDGEHIALRDYIALALAEQRERDAFVAEAQAEGNHFGAAVARGRIHGQRVDVIMSQRAAAGREIAAGVSVGTCW